MSPMNLHNHTPFSDGAFSIDEICEAHLALPGPAIEAIGVSDHLFRMPASKECRNDAEFARVFAAETRHYVQEVQEARRRWAGRMHIFCGCEVYWPLNRAHLEVMRGLLDGIDYVLFECVDWAGLTVLANQSRRFPCPIGLAHTNVAKQMPNTPFEQVVRTLANARMFFEISAKYLPLADRDPWFATLAKHRVNVSLGTDTHDEIAVVQSLPVLAAFAQRVGVGDRGFRPGAAAERVKLAVAG